MISLTNQTGFGTWCAIVIALPVQDELGSKYSARLDVLPAVKSPSIIFEERCKFFLLGLGEGKSISEGHVALAQRSMGFVLLQVDGLSSKGLVVELVLGRFAPTGLDLKAGVASPVVACQMTAQLSSGPFVSDQFAASELGVALVAQVLQGDGTIVRSRLELLVPGEIVVPYEVVPSKSPLILNFSEL